MMLVMARAALPCSCGDQRPCGKVVRSSAVFTGLTLSGGDGWKSPTARFRVIQAFKGVKSGAVVQVDTASQTSCAAQFQIGKEYIVYAAGTGERLSTTACSGSRLTAESQQEVRYLNAWLQRKTPTEVLGYVIPDIRGDEQDWKRAYSAVGKAQVNVVGRDGRNIEVHPDAHGEFAVRVPSSGPYQVSVSLPKWIANRPMETVEVPEFGCGEAGFQMRPDGQLAGRAISKNGDAVRNVLLKLVPMSDFGLTFETTTDKEGHFRFRGVLPGAYRLGVNPDNMDDPSPSVPFAPTFYPGVGDQNTAAVLRISESQVLELGRPFRLPPKLQPRTIRVTVTLENGHPVHGASVSCTPEGHSYWRKDSTDSHGLIVFAAMDKVAYIIDADVPSYNALATSQYERARWLRVPPGTGTADVRVVLRKRASK